MLVQWRAGVNEGKNMARYVGLVIPDDVLVDDGADDDDDPDDDDMPDDLSQSDDVNDEQQEDDVSEGSSDDENDDGSVQVIELEVAENPDGKDNSNVVTVL